MNKIIFAAIPALLLSTGVFAQDVPEASKKDLWCGLAFGLVSADVPADVTPEQQAVIDQYKTGGDGLVSKAKAVHLESGYTEETYTTYEATLKEDIRAQVSSTENTATYSFEECSALLGL
jgi:hypothetical protein